jgi:FixJ family two-component response regulator
MYYYVNHQAMGEVFKPIEVETDPRVRVELIRNIETEFANRIISEYERTCHQLKIAGWSTGQIAEAMDISERKVKTFIRWHSETSGEWNPLQRRQLANVVDISHLVARKSAGQASPPGPAPHPA